MLYDMLLIIHIFSINSLKISQKNDIFLAKQSWKRRLDVSGIAQNILREARPITLEFKLAC